MTQSATPEFETFTPDQLKESDAFKVEEKKADETWSNRIATVGVGGGFRAHRTEGESVRQLKRRINAAAGSPVAGFKTLEWKPEAKNLPDGFPASWLVRVKAINLTEKAAYEKAQAEASQDGRADTSQNGSNASPEGQQTTDGGNSGESDPENQPAQIGRRRG